MKERKTEKVFDVWDLGAHVYCIKYLQEQQAPYRIFCRWYASGWHQKLLGKATNLVSALQYITRIYADIQSKTSQERGI